MNTSGSEARAGSPSAPRHQRFNIGAYRGLIDTVDTVKEKVDKERADALQKQKYLADLLAERDKSSKKIQKELSVQLKVSCRSYQSLLTANREISEQLAVEERRRVDEVEELQKKIKKLNETLKVIEKPWKEEVTKRDQKIVKLQESNQDYKRLVKKESEKVQPVVDKYEQELREREGAMESVLREIKALREQIEEQKQMYEAQIAEIPKPFQIEIVKLHKEKREITEAAEDAEAKLKREKKELDKKIVGLEKQLAETDYTPYEKKIDAQAEGYARLCKDFSIATQKTGEEKTKMRQGFEDIIERMDRQIQNNEREMLARLKPFEEQIERKDAKIEHLTTKIEEMREAEVETRKKEKHIEEDLRKELKVAKDAVDLAIKETTQAKREAARVVEEIQGDEGPWKRMKMMEVRLDDVTKECQAIVAHKDFEMKQKTDMITRLQKKLIEDTKRFEDFAEMWDHRMQQKEKGYNKAIAELAFAEGQIVEERKRTQIEREKVAARERDIKRLQEEHTEELRVRQVDREELEAHIAELEEAMEIECRKPEVMRTQFQAEIDAFKRRAEDRVYDLRIEIARRDQQIEEEQFKILDLQEKMEKARAAWEEKERELEVYIRARDRNITALKNELEFLNDSWEIKYQRLLELYEKLQKKYDDVIGPNGQSEAFRRAMALKDHNETLNQKIKQLEEVIAKQKKQIRGLQLDIDQIMKETADLIAEKERGIAEMAGDAVKLENKYREECLLRERLLQQKDAERLSLAESFQARVEQLEQLMEAMRFNDREELLERIALWKKNYERVCNERDDIEEHYKELVETKEKQLFGMLVENGDLRRQIEIEKDNGRLAVEKVEKKWQAQDLLRVEETAKVQRRVEELELELDKALREAARQALLKEKVMEDPEKTQLRARIKELEEQMAIIEAGKKGIIDENTMLRGRTEGVDSNEQAIHDDYAKQLKEKDKQMKLMEISHEELKAILQKEMKRAQETCKGIEEQVRRFPEPFELEIQEMKDKYAQMQVGLQKIQIENVYLREHAEETQTKLENEIRLLEESLGLAKHLLNEVATLDSLKHLSKAEIINLEEVMDKDIDGDGMVGNKPRR